MVYGVFNYLPRRTSGDNVVRNRAFNIGNNPRYYGYQRGLASIVC